MKTVGPDSGAGNPPCLDDQKVFWDEWNQSWRFRPISHFMQRQLEVAVEVAQKKRLHDARILEVGCGTGWLGNALLPFGRVWATDISEGAIEEGRRRHPEVQLLCADFLTVDLPGPFDLIVSADSLIHMYDQQACVRRIATLLSPGGTFLLMTQNRVVWRHRTALKPQCPGQIQNWRSLGEYKALLRPFFKIERITSIDPGGDKGLLWWVENRHVTNGMSRIVGWRRWPALLEAALLGRELVFVASRTS